MSDKLRTDKSNSYSTKEHGETWIKSENTEDLWSRTKQEKTQYNISAGKEIILLIHELKLSRTAHGF